MAWQAADIGPGKFLHGIDQHRQPPSFAVSRPPGFSRPRGLCRMPWLKLLTHRLSLPEPASTDPAINPKVADQFRGLAVKKPVRCDLLHKRPAGLVVNQRNGPENTSNARFPGRHGHRLCLDRHRRRRCLDRADLSHPDLMRPQAAARDVCRLGLSMPACE
jgi:hypothetical protein